MKTKLDEMLLKHDRAVVAAGKSYFGQVSSVTREETAQQFTALLDTEIAKAKIEELEWVKTKCGRHKGGLYLLAPSNIDLRIAELADTESNKEGVEVNE